MKIKNLPHIISSGRLINHFTCLGNVGVCVEKLSSEESSALKSDCYFVHLKRNDSAETMTFTLNP